jgi:hypothetical protein
MNKPDYLAIISYIKVNKLAMALRGVVLGS